MRNLVKFYQLILKILSGNENLTSIKGHNSLTNLQKISGNNHKLHLVNSNAHVKFDQFISFSSQDIERKLSSE